MGESANLAVYAIVYSKGLLPRARLQDAMDKATLDGIPLESVLIQWRLLNQPQYDEVIRIRSRLGRKCQKCGSTTFLLPDQNEAGTPCEFCGGPLLVPRTSGRMRRPQAHPGSGGYPQPQVPSPPHSPGTGSALPLPDMARLEERIVQQALQTVETRLEKEDLAGFLKHVTKKASQKALEAVQGKFDQLSQELTQQAIESIRQQIDNEMGGMPQRITDQVLERVQDHLAQRGAPDTDEIVERATRASLQALQVSVDRYDLPTLPDRVASQVLDSLQGQLPGSNPAPDLVEQTEKIKRQVLEAIQHELAASASGEEIVAQATQGAIQALQEYDLPTLPERVTQQVLERVGKRDDPSETDLSEQIETALRERLPALVEQLTPQVGPQILQGIERSLGMEMRELPQRILEQVMRQIQAQGLGSPSPGGGDSDKVMAQVERRLSEFDLAAEALVQEATAKAVEAMEAKLSRENAAAVKLPGKEEEAPIKGTTTGVYDRKFLALAREVKHLKDQLQASDMGVLANDEFKRLLDNSVRGAVTSISSAETRRGIVNSEEFKSLVEARINQALHSMGASTGGSKKGGDLVGLLNTAEFKEFFDSKINQVITYLKNDLVPEAVKKHLREVESS